MSAYREQFERAVRAAMAGATVLTENTRSSRALLAASEQRLRAQSEVWPTPEILPFGAFVERLYGEAVVSGVVALEPLGREQELELWRQIIGRSAAGKEILLPESAAALASDAFRTACEYGIALDSVEMSATPESREFSGWAAQIRTRLAGQSLSAAALLPQELTGCLKRLRLPREVYCFLPEVTPAQRGFLTVLEETGTAVERMPTFSSGAEAAGTRSAVQRYEFDGEREELQAAALWARRQVEASPGSRVGVILFDLAGRAALVESVFASVLHPEGVMRKRTAPPFEIAAPRALAEYPMVRCALEVLSLLAAPVDFGVFDAALRSPYLGLGPEESQSDAVARFLSRARKDARRQLDWKEFMRWLDEAGELAELRAALKKLPAHPPLSSMQPVERWVEFARAVLEAFGWPNGVALDSEEFQCLESWGDLFASVALLESLGCRTDFGGFVDRLRRAAAGRRFKPETLGAPVQVMDVAESEGSCFDALWIGGCSDEQWPEQRKLTPLIPAGMLKAAGVPAPGTEQAEARVERITARLLQSAPEISLSLALHCDDEREQRWSPLFCHCGEPIRRGVGARPLALCYAPAVLEEYSDAAAPPLEPEEQVRGGSWLLQEQSDCPFRAFAIRRLRAVAPEGPNEELDALTRGRILDSALQEIWKVLRDSEGLRRDDLAVVIVQGVEHAMARELPRSFNEWTERLRELERQRNIEVLSAWLRVEAGRRPFRVLAHQEEVEVELGGLPLRGRLDRLDQVASDQFVIDYKTGRNIGVSSWKVPRPRQPQLPFYALALRRRGVEPAGIAFATIRRDECSFKAYQREKGMLSEQLPGAQSLNEVPFNEYMNLWEVELEHLASSFASGEAAVDPVNPPGRNGSPCRLCHLQALCRIGDEGPLGLDDEAEEASDE